MKTYSTEERNKRVEEWRQSGKSAWAYAKENGVNLKTLKNWIKAEKEDKQDFVEIQSKPTCTQDLIPVILIEKGNIRIYVPLAIGHVELRAVIEGLGTAV